MDVERPRNKAQLCDRRTLLKGAAATVVAPSAARGAIASRRGQPNILFILADDLGYADLSCYGRREYRTPVLDKLAADGLLMRQGYANSPVCSPTRIALITGRYQYRLRAGLEEPIVRRDATVGLPPTHPTLPSTLASAGYRTALVGKWHMGWPPNHGPLKSGYQRFFGIYPGATDYFSHSGDGEAVPEDTSLIDGDTPVERVGYLTDLLAERARAEIAEASAAGKPFFVSLHFTAPHWPWQGPGDAATARKWRNLFHLNAGSLQKYSELVIAMDAAIGNVLSDVDRLGLRENTIVVFTSDNGGERFSDNWPLRGEKTDLLEGGIRVPVLVRWPSRIPPGRTSDQVISSMDWMPTLVAAAGAKPDARNSLDGQNLVDVLTGTSPQRERRIFWRYKNRDQAAARIGPWKYLRRGGSEALYNIVDDPRERADLKEDLPSRLEELKREYVAWNASMLPYPANSISAGSE